jgi:hypothetical protein
MAAGPSEVSRTLPLHRTTNASGKTPERALRLLPDFAERSGATSTTRTSMSCEFILPSLPHRLARIAGPEGALRSIVSGLNLFRLCCV